MKFLILVRSEALHGCPELIAEMSKAGVHVAAEGLANPSLAAWVSVRGGQTIISERPTAGVAERLAGFYLIDCPGRAEAIEWAAKVPAAADAPVEVRPVLDLCGWEY